jgi:hypothetical protein
LSLFPTATPGADPLDGVPRALVDDVAEAIVATLRADPVHVRIAVGGIHWRHVPELGIKGTKPCLTVCALLYASEHRISLQEKGRFRVGIYWEFEALGNQEVGSGEASIGSLLRHTMNTIDANSGLLLNGNPTVQGYTRTWTIREPILKETPTSQTYICGVEPEFQITATLTGRRIGT